MWTFMLGGIWRPAGKHMGAHWEAYGGPPGDIWGPVLRHNFEDCYFIQS